eukprot:4874029-Prymnesium_polylepis.2
MRPPRGPWLRRAVAPRRPLSTVSRRLTSLSRLGISHCDMCGFCPQKPNIGILRAVRDLACCP